MICRGRRPRFSTSITSAPAARATPALSVSTAGTLALPNGEMPSTSQTVAMVLAVNWPPQAPAPGQAWRSSASSSAVGMVPAACAPTASNTSWMVTSRSCQRPGAIEPP